MVNVKYILSKHCDFSRKKECLIGYVNLSFRNGVWIPQYHMNVDDTLNSGYEEKMQAFCKYIKDVIVPNGYESIEYLPSLPFKNVLNCNLKQWHYRLLQNFNSSTNEVSMILIHLYFRL